MQKPWRNYDPFEFEPIDLAAVSTTTQQLINSYTIEFVALGLVHAGDYRLHSEWSMQTTRFFQSADGAVLGWVTDRGEKSTYSFASLLSDGTLVQSTPTAPTAPWNCCRFPVHVNFGSGCCLEELLVMHLKSVADLELGCGPVVRYGVSQVRDVVLYMQMLVHETLHGAGAPAEPLPVPRDSGSRQLAVHR